ncbi:hypothetical protein FHU13_002998 [Methylobacterium sp. R2-1]|nr:hypothetical protein [Methylobacterium sp. R2-1]
MAEIVSLKQMSPQPFAKWQRSQSLRWCAALSNPFASLRHFRWRVSGDGLNEPGLSAFVLLNDEQGWKLSCKPRQLRLPLR